MRPGGLEILVIVLVVLLVFGASKIPQIGEALGKGIGAFKKGAQEADEPKKKKTAKKGGTASATKAAEAPGAKVSEASETSAAEETAKPEAVIEKT